MDVVDEDEVVQPELYMEKVQAVLGGSFKTR